MNDSGALLSIALTLTIAGHDVTECGLCSSLVPAERLARHVRVMHPGWRYESGGPQVGCYTKGRGDERAMEPH